MPIPVAARHGLVLMSLVTASLLGACTSPREGPVAFAGGPPGPTCEARKEQLLERLAALPTSPAVSVSRVVLPRSILGSAPGAGPVIEVTLDGVTLDGKAMPSRGHADAVQQFTEWVQGWLASPASEPSEPSKRGPLYFAVPAELDVATVRDFLVRVPRGVELRLLVRTPEASSAPASPSSGLSARDLSARLLTDPDPRRRHALATEGYARFADCAAVSTAVAATESTGGTWAARRAALLEALPHCACGALDTASLASLVAAEARGGVGALGYVPLTFLRDERCGATMPLRAVGKLVGQLEAFDAEFAAKFQGDTVRFEDVLNSDRLRVYFCDALPGETLAAKERAHGTLYQRVPGSAVCDAWTFHPLTLGAPMGTLGRAAHESRAALAFHYWQASEEIRLFGPVDDPASKPTDEGPFRCEETFRLTGVEDESIHLGPLQWFYTEAACLQAPPGTIGFKGCVADHAGR